MATTDTSADSIFAHRVAMFEEMGFSAQSAEDLAHAKGANGWPLDTHLVRKMLKAECSIELALKILL